VCWKTEAGLVHSVGEIKLETPKDLPESLQGIRYVIFKEDDDMLGLNYHAVCIDLVLNSRNTAPNEAYRGLRDSVASFIDVTLEHATDKQLAYNALIEQKEDRDDARELIYRVYNEILAHNETILYAKLRPHYKRLYDSVYSKLRKEGSLLEYSHFYTSAYSEEDIEKLRERQSSNDKIKKIIASNYYLLFNSIIMIKSDKVII